MVIPGSVIKLKDAEPGITQIIPQAKQAPGSSSFLSGLLSILGIAISIAVPALAPEGLAATVVAETAAVGLDLSFQAASARAAGTKLGLGNAIFTLVGSGAAAASAIKASSIVKKSKNVVEEVAANAASKGYNSKQFDVLTKQVEDAVIEKASARTVSQQLVRAGFTDQQALEQLEYFSNVFKNNGINIGRFDDEISFIKQEKAIFQELSKVTKKFGIDINELFRTLENSGIDIVGVETTHQLTKAIRANSNAVRALKDNELFTELEGALERDLDPTFFTRVLNAKNAEKGVEKVNKLLSLANPNAFITEVTNKIFDPLKSKIEKKVLDPFKKKTQQKLKHLIRQDLVRKQETKNGVYPCFGSSWINYLRAVPLSKGIYKCLVVMRKWGYKPVTITPEFKLQDIINWSESSSPGRIYHKFRQEFGTPKGQLAINSEELSFDANTASIFNLLGYIPDKYISLGVSLVGSIASARSTVSLDTWADYFKNTDNLFRPLEDKGLELVGGQAAKAVRDQAAGNRQAVQSYLQGKATESLESRESEYRKSRKDGRGKIDSVRSLNGIIK